MPTFTHGVPPVQPQMVGTWQMWVLLAWAWGGGEAYLGADAWGSSLTPELA